MFVLLAHRPGALGTPAADLSVLGNREDRAPLPLPLALLPDGLLWLGGGWVLFFYSTSSHCLNNMFLEFGCAFHAPLHMWHNKLFAQLLDEQPAGIVHTTHAIRVLFGEVDVGIEGGNIQHIVPENHGPPRGSPLTWIVANYLIHCVHSSFCLVVALDHFWFLPLTVIPCLDVMHGAQEDNSLSLLLNIAHHGHVAIESKFGAMNLPWFGWLHDRWYVWLVLAKSPNNGQVLLQELLSKRDTDEKVVHCDVVIYERRERLYIYLTSNSLNSNICCIALHWIALYSTILLIVKKHIMKDWEKLYILLKCMH